MKLKEYDIILLKKSGTLLGNTIKKALKSRYYHSELYLGNYMFLTTDYKRGVKIKLLDNNFEDFDVYRYKGNLTRKQKDIIEEFVQKSINKRYDFVESLGLVFNKRWGDEKKYNCITLTLRAFENAGINATCNCKNFERITNNKNFEKIRNIKNIKNIKKH